MIVLLQRVKKAQVVIQKNIHAEIKTGLLAFVCAEPQDTPELIDKALKKILQLRVFSDAKGKMNLSLQQIKGELLIVSQFTLAADTRKGNRPSFMQSAPPEQARVLYQAMVERAHQLHSQVKSGQFAADMQVHLINDGPVTIPLHF